MGSNIGAKNSYRKVNLMVTEIRDNSVFFVSNKAATTVSFGRSLLSYLSDERLKNYNGPLPQEFALEVAAWRVKQGDM